MADEIRIRALLEEMLESQRTPEEVCADTPDLLREVRVRWEHMRRVGYEIDAFFPAEGPTKLEGGAPHKAEIELPHLAGYELESVLGRGGMGVVFKARHLKLNRFVALKMMLAGPYAGPMELGRFRREAEAVAALRHPNVVQVFDVGDLAGQHYFTMEFVEGGSLAQKLAGTPQPPRQAAEMIATLACGVQFAHKSGFIHRDLKPANILLMADGSPKITDFGLARSIEGGPEFTLSGARVGTPSYMAPEQAMGKAYAVGPATDVYSLGAILYEMLTGRPPFDGESAAETERRVIAEEPIPPSRLNPRVPRDLETICLKCLEKNPSRRYASAQDLGDDLHRFLDGRPVLARPVGALQRTVKWARRRPALAMLIAAMLVALTAASLAAVWLYREESGRQTEKSGRQANARQAIEAILAKVYQAAKAERWQEAKVVLAEADSHLGNADSDDLRQRIEQAESDLQFVQKLERIRQSAVSAVAETNAKSPHSVDFQLLATEYRKVFQGAGLNVDGDAATAAARIRTALGDKIVSALDEWALAAFMLKRADEQEQLFKIARLADPDPAWGDRLRDSSAWGDQEKLRKLAADASLARKPLPAHHLGMLAHLGAKSQSIALLRAALVRRPNDYWLNWEMATALMRDANYKEAVPYFRVVVALRPENAWTISHLGCALLFVGDLNESIAQLRHATELEPQDQTLQQNLVAALAKAKLTNEAQEASKRLLEARPQDAEAAFSHGIALASAGRHEEAIPLFQKAIELNPHAIRAHYNLGVALAFTERYEQAVVAFRNTVKLDPTDVFARYGLGVALQELGKHDEALEEFERIIRELEPKVKPALAGSGDGHYGRYVSAHIRQARLLYCLGRFAESQSVIQRAQKLPNLSQAGHDELRSCLILCQRLAAFESRLPAILAEKEIPEDIAKVRALAEWCYKYRRLTVAGVRFYEVVFARQPALADDLAAKHRYHAACAAALAASGTGEDASKLDASAKAGLRKKALEWLRADVDGWTKRLNGAKEAQSAFAARAKEWQLSKELTSVRDPAARAKLTENERKAWQSLWADMKGLLWRDPLERARAHVADKQWTLASEAYAQAIKDRPGADDEAWFEYAAVQLLSGDRQGYRQTCKSMLDAVPNGKMRPYLAARAWTLAPNALSDMTVVSQVSAGELKSAPNASWSLTEQGALCCRTNRARDARALFDKSLRAESKPGNAVLNWLWLAVARQSLGEIGQARVWLDKAGTWLDSLGNQLPANADALSLHRHNWLEAHVLRREAEKLIAPSLEK